MDKLLTNNDWFAINFANKLSYYKNLYRVLNYNNKYNTFYKINFLYNNSKK